jgi:DNA (cytosine-5)-methyltransferase 1
MCAASGQANAEILDELCPSLNCDHEQPICFDARGNGDGKTAPPLAGDHGNRVTDYTAIVQTSIVRRLTPLECERLQGYPDGWTDITWTPPHRKTPERAKDSSRYKALGNSIALPPWAWVCGRIREQYNRPITLGSLFDGIGGFPLVWERINGKGTALWASEIEPFCVAVTAQRFEKNKCAKKQNALLGMNESEGTP